MTNDNAPSIFWLKALMTLGVICVVGTTIITGMFVYGTVKHFNSHVNHVIQGE